MRKRWRGCLGQLACFGKQKGGKRIVPASRVPESNVPINQPNGAQAGGLTNPAAALLAPPSSPASFSNSALPSTAQSPNCFLSANSPVGPSSTMFATGPYAHETQLVSPPVFSTFTTEPSTAPLTPPPELAHLTTPSSPDVPYAQFLSSSVSLKNVGRANYMAANDTHIGYSVSPASPAASSLRSPISRASRDSLSASFPDRNFTPQWDPLLASQDKEYSRSDSGRLFGLEGASKKSQDSNFFCPATFAQFYLDPSSFPQSGGRLSVSKEADAYSYSGNGNQNRQNKSIKQDVEEIEAYRASFGFSADEIVTTTHYVEIADVADDSFSMSLFPSIMPLEEENSAVAAKADKAKPVKARNEFPSLQYSKPGFNQAADRKLPVLDNGLEGQSLGRQPGQISVEHPTRNHILSDDDDIFSKMGASRIGHLGLSSSDAEVEYRRSRSLKLGRGSFARRD